MAILTDYKIYPCVCRVDFYDKDAERNITINIPTELKLRTFDEVITFLTHCEYFDKKYHRYEEKYINKKIVKYIFNYNPYHKYEWQDVPFDDMKTVLYYENIW